MTCICVFDLKEIRHSGADVGDNWSHTITVDEMAFVAKASRHGGVGVTDRIKIEHRWTLEDKPCGTTVEIPLSVCAEETDLFFNDRGEKIRLIEVKCPGPGGAPFKLSNHEIKVDVQERPAFLAGIDSVTFVFDIKAFCAQD